MNKDYKNIEKMKRKTYLLPLITMYIIVAILFGLLIRNNHILIFRNKLLWHDWNNIPVLSEEYATYRTDIYEKYSYNQYLFSFKPLKVEYWFTTEEIEKYNLKNLI